MKMQSRIYGNIQLTTMIIRIVGFLKMNGLVYRMAKMRYI